jgi:HK97 family phage major capsid protein
MATQAQNALKNLRGQAEALEIKNASNQVWSAEDMTAYQGILDQANVVKKQIDAQDAMAALKGWMDSPDGQSSVKTGFTREATPNEGAIDGITADPMTGELYSTKGVGDPKLSALKSGAYKDAFNEYIRSAATKRAMKDASMKVLNEGADESGGFWVPPDFRSEVVKKIAAGTTVRQDAFVFTTGSDVVKFPRVNYTTDDKYTSGVRFGWGGALAAADISEATNPIAGQETIPVHLAAAAVMLTRSQLEDTAFDVLGYLSMVLAEAYMLGEEDVFWNGTGAGQPTGILAHPNASVAHSGGGMYVTTGTSAKLDWGYVTAASGTPGKGIIGLEAALPPQYEANAKFYGNKAVWANVRGFSDTTGRPLWNLVDQWPSMSNGYAATLLGYPVRKTQFMPDVAADSLSIALGDLKGYYIPDRVGLSIEIFRELRGLRDEVVVYARKRLGGQLVQDWRVKLLKAAS